MPSQQTSQRNNDPTMTIEDALNKIDGIQADLKSIELAYPTTKKMMRAVNLRR